MTNERQIIDDLLAEYADDTAPGACDRCEQCGPMVMCSFHSVLSVLLGRVSTSQGHRLAAQASPPTDGDGLVARIERHLEDVMSPSVTHRLLGEASSALQRVASPPTPEPMRECLEWIASQTNLFFAECSQAEEIIHRVKLALASSLSDTGETPT